MNIYLASRFRTLPDVLALKNALIAAGHAVLSTWHDHEAVAPMPYGDERYPSHAEQVARRDLMKSTGQTP